MYNAEGTGDEPMLLRQTVTSALQAVVELKLPSLALPLVSSGAFCCPVQLAADIAVAAVIEFLEQLDKPDLQASHQVIFETTSCCGHRSRWHCRSALQHSFAMCVEQPLRSLHVHLTAVGGLHACPDTPNPSRTAQSPSTKQDAACGQQRR